MLFAHPNSNRVAGGAAVSWPQPHGPHRFRSAACPPHDRCDLRALSQIQFRTRELHIRRVSGGETSDHRAGDWRLPAWLEAEYAAMAARGGCPGSGRQGCKSCR